MAALVRVVLGAMVLGCAPTGPAVVRSGGQRWPVPDGACEAIQPARYGVERHGSREHMLEWHGDATLAKIESLGGGSLDRDTIEQLLWIDVFERERVYPELLRGERPEIVAEARARRAAIDRIKRGAADTVVDVALAMGEPRLVTPDVLAAADGVATSARLHTAIACAADGPDEALVPLLAELRGDVPRATLRGLARWPAWRVQVEALRALGASDDPLDVVLREDLRRTHWSAVVREVARDPLGPVPAVDSGTRRLDHGGRSCTAADGIARVRWRGELREIPQPAGGLPDAMPSGFVVVEGELLDLREEGHIAVHLDPQWLVGVHRGEFASGLFVIEALDDVRRLDPAPVVDMLSGEDGMIVVSGLNHLGLAEGRVMGIASDDRGHLIRRHRFELPGTPRAAVMDRGTLLVATDEGVIALDPDGAATLLRCAD